FRQPIWNFQRRGCPGNGLSWRAGSPPPARGPPQEAGPCWGKEGRQGPEKRKKGPTKKPPPQKTTRTQTTGTTPAPPAPPPRPRRRATAPTLRHRTPRLLDAR